MNSLYDVNYYCYVNIEFTKRVYAKIRKLVNKGLTRIECPLRIITDLYTTNTGTKYSDLEHLLNNIKKIDCLNYSVSTRLVKFPF